MRTMINPLFTALMKHSDKAAFIRVKHKDKKLYPEITSGVKVLLPKIFAEINLAYHLAGLKEQSIAGGRPPYGTTLIPVRTWPPSVQPSFAYSVGQKCHQVF